MQDEERSAAARQLAEEYAPRPVSSILMYGVVGVCLAALAWAAFSGFYGLDPFAYPVWMAVAFSVAFMGGAALRIVRSKRHTAAHRREYDQAGRG